VLERCSRSFWLFLKALKGPLCPLCVVWATFEQERLASLEHTELATDGLPLCGNHVRLGLKLVAERGARARINLVRAGLGFDVAHNASRFASPCEICQSVETASRGLVAAMRRLDRQIRFEKALQRGPLFCRFHAAEVCTGGAAPNFARIQSDKLKELSEKLLQALYCSDGDLLEHLVDDGIRYVEGRKTQRLNPKANHSIELSAEETNGAAAERVEFERWDNQQVLKHLSDLETEVAKLRYLVGENRRLKLAHAAVEAVREDLEREREALRRGDGASNGREPNNRSSG